MDKGGAKAERGYPGPTRGDSCVKIWQCIQSTYSPHRKHSVHRCGLLLQTLHVSRSVCWSHGLVVQKWLNWWRCCLGEGAF